MSGQLISPNLPRYSQLFLANMARPDCFMVLFKELEPIGIISVGISGLNEVKIDWKIAENDVCVQQ